MRIWKKALSAGLTAMLLASLTVSSTFAAAGDSDQTDWLNCTVANVHTVVTCSQVADGISSVTLAGGDIGVTGAANGSLYITATGASIIGVTGTKFSLAAGTVTTGLLGIGAALVAADTITLRSPAAAGTTVVSVYLIDGGTGLAGEAETLTITWTATSGLGVSVANSVVQTNVAASDCSVLLNAFDDVKLATASALSSGTTVAELCMLVRDGNGTVVPNGTSVAATITPYGLVGPAATFGQTSTSVTAGGVAKFHVVSAGIAGLSTIATQVTLGTTTTAFAPITFTFTGAVASITLANASSVGGVGLNVDDALTFVAKDTAGNQVPLLFSALTATYSTGAPFTITVGSNTGATATVSGKIDATCGATAGTGTVTVKTVTPAVTSNAVTFNCSTAADTYTVAFDKDPVTPGGQATITVTAKDAGGRPAPDGLSVTIVVSAGATLPIQGAAVLTKNGVATWTYLAPFNTGVVTVLASASVLTTTSPRSASTNVGAVVPATTGAAATALGATKTGTYTIDTKVAALGKYVTWKFSFGASAAGQTVGVMVATKNSAGVWSTFTRLTGRVADSNGDAYFWIYKASAAWISVQGDLGGGLTPARQARWK